MTDEPLPIDADTVSARLNLRRYPLAGCRAAY